jgi:hypothetical protein
MIHEQISLGLQKLYAVVELMQYHDLSDLQRELGFLDLMIEQRKQKLAKEVLNSEKMERR